MDLRILELRDALSRRRVAAEADYSFQNTLEISAESHKVDDDGNVQVNFESDQVKRVLKNRLNTLRQHKLKNSSA